MKKQINPLSGLGYRPVIRLLIGLIAAPGAMNSQGPVVVFPNGGQTLTVGSTVTITWSGTPLNTIVGIDYTINNWTTTTWLTTSYSNPSANSYTWVVPNTPGTQCKVGVFDTSFQGDISDNFFTIAPVSAPAVVANFTFSGTTCAGFPLNFSDQSVGAPTGWAWSVVPSASVTTPSSQNPIIKFPNPGNYTVTLVSSNSTGSSTPVSKIISISACTDVMTFLTNEDEQIKVYPNPVKDKLSVDVLRNYGEPLSFELYDATRILCQRATLAEGTNRIYVHSLTSGIYFFRITSGRAVLRSGKIILE